MKSVLSLLSAAAMPAPSSTPSPLATATPFPWDTCDQNPTLPYDHPLELKMRVLDGPDFDLMHYRGYATILHIFATWCGPCAEEIPVLVQLANQYYGKGLRVVGIDVQESDNTVRAYRKKYAIPFPIAMDQNGGFSYNMEIGGKSSGNVVFPVDLFITPAGYLYCDKQGTTKAPLREMTYRIEKFLKDAPPTKLAASS